MPKRYRLDFKQDVVVLARTSGLTHAQIATYFEVSEHLGAALAKPADIDDGIGEDPPGS